MSLRGDTRALGLADIFQALALSKREGTLSVSSGGKEVKVYFSDRGVRLLSTGALRHTRLGSILLEKENFPPENLEFALQLQKSTGKKLGEVLVEYGMLKQDDIDICLRRQFEEEICEIFLWNDAEFSFDPGPPREDFFDPAGDGRAFDLNVSRLLVEAARNVDEWSVLLNRIQNASSKFVYRNGFPVMPDTSPFGIPLVVVSRLPFVLNTPRTVDELSAELQLNRDSTAKLLAYLVRRGRVLEITDQPSLKPLDESPRKPVSEDWRKPRAWSIDDLSYRARLDEIVLSAESPEEAASRMTELSEMASRERETGIAIEILKAALELVPHDVALRKKVIQTYVSQWKFAEAAKLVVEGCQLEHATVS